MNRYEFMNRLYKQLQPMEQSELDSIMYDYEEHFDNAIADGKDEETIVSDLGNPDKIAKELRATATIKMAQVNPSSKNIYSALIAILGLGLLNFFLVLPAIITYISVIFSMILLTFLFTISPIFLALDYAINGKDAVSWFEVFMTVAQVGVGFVFISLLYHVIRISKNILLKYLQWNLNTMKGGN